VRSFSLKQNPFSVLKVSPRARLAEIEDAFEGAVIASPNEEPHLLRLKQELLTPNARLVAELSWLPELAPNRANQLLATLESSSCTSSLSAIDELPPLAAANLAADGANRFRDCRFIYRVLEAHQKLDVNATIEVLNSTRASAGFARIETIQFDEGVRNLRVAHARACLSAIVSQPEPATALSAILANCPNASDIIVGELLREYDNWSAPQLGQLEQDIDTLLSSLEAEGSREIALLVHALRSWDKLSQPAQLYAQHSGLDEERTLRIYRKVRSKCVELANDQQRFDDAHTITSEMADLFKELPTAASETRTDLETLARLSAEVKLSDELQPLLDGLENARGNLAKICSDLKENVAESVVANQATKGLIAAYNSCTTRMAAGKNADAPHRLLRNFALELNNDHDDAAAALALLVIISDHKDAVGEELRTLLQQDIATLQNNCDHGKLDLAINREDWAGALTWINRIQQRTLESDKRAELEKLRRTVEEKRNSRNLKRAGWAAAAVFVLFLIMSEDNNKTAATSQSAAPMPTGSSTTPEVSNDDWKIISSPPPVGTDHVLDASQLRYCIFEEATLKELSNLASADSAKAVEGYNSRIEDYNSRCSSFRYRKKDLEAVNRALAASSLEISETAQRIAGEWAE